MSVLVIVLIIILGLFLIALEFFVFPGVTIAGIGGFIFVSGGVYLTYTSFGSAYGNVALLVTVLTGIIMLVMSFRSKTWNRLMLKSSIEAQVETVEEENIHVGDEGLTITRLNPIGKVRVNNELIEGRCPGSFVDENTAIIVEKVYKTYIIVKPKN